MIDTHAHLYDEKFAHDLPDLMEKMALAGVEKVYMPNLNLATIPSMIALEKAHPNHFSSMLGLHPCDVREKRLEADLKAMEEWLDRHPFVAIGEVGLDFYWSRKEEKAQYKALERQMAWAHGRKLPIVFHARNSLDEVIEITQKSPLRQGIFHCFSGSIAQAEAIVAMGFHLGIGGLLTFPKSPLKAVVAAIDLQHFVLESDAPYLSPAPLRGKRNSPHHLPYVVDQIAEIKGCSRDAVIEATTEAAKKIFQKIDCSK